jgi:MFS family permease
VRIARVFSQTVLLAASGYFVDIYDLVLFGVVRVSSLKELGISGTGLLTEGVFLLNVQTAGILLGGFVWGVCGDKVGRVRALFGSILFFSLATLANAFVHSIGAYACFRFIAGVGLAGELGVGITLVAEALPKELRAHASSIVIVVGILGAVFASMVSGTLGWREGYGVGGLLGLGLLLMRGRFSDPSVFLKQCQNAQEKHGVFIFLKRSKSTFVKYAKCILIGVPVQFAPAILIAFSPEIMAGRNFGRSISIGTSIIFNYIGTGVGAILASSLSHAFRSRMKIILFFLVMMWLFVFLFLWLPHQSLSLFYFLSLLVGIGGGFWSIYILMCSELFGTNVRATSTTTIINLSRAGMILMTSVFALLSRHFESTGAAFIVGTVSIVLAILAGLKLPDSFERDLDYTELT